MITETLARALTLEELAQRLADEHSDPVVRDLCKKIVETGIEQDEDLQAELDEASREVTHVESKLEEKEQELSDIVEAVSKAIKDTRDRGSLVIELEKLL